MTVELKRKADVYRRAGFCGPCGAMLTSTLTGTGRIRRDCAACGWGYEACEKPRPADEVVIGIDPGRFTGWSFLRQERLVAHGVIDHGPGSFTAEDVVRKLMSNLNALCPEGRVALVAVEKPYIPEGKPGRAASAGLVYARAGFIMGALWVAFPSADRWFPNAASWRKVLGLNRGGQKRGDVNPRVFDWASYTVRAQGTRPKGLEGGPTGATLDEANAICLAHAAAETIRYPVERRSVGYGRAKRSKGKKKKGVGT